MSNENAQLVRRFYESGLIDRDPDELTSSRLPISNTSTLPTRLSRVCAPRGQRSRAGHRAFAEVWEESRHEVRELYDYGEVVVVAVSWHIRSRGEARPRSSTKRRIPGPCGTAESLVSSGGQDLGKALEAAGLSE